MTLGQTLDTLSGGEIQRVKLSKYLTKPVENQIFVFDEPTTGLHEDDIPILLDCFNNLIAENNTLIIIEHNLTMMTEADWIVDISLKMQVLMEDSACIKGYPAGLLSVEQSLTAKHLQRYIK